MQEEVIQSEHLALSREEQRFVANISKCGARVLSALVACGGQATYEKLVGKMRADTGKDYRLQPAVTKFRRVTNDLSNAHVIAKVENENDLSTGWYSITNSGRKVFEFIKLHHPHLLEPSKSP